ncbi:MAG: hypothetical protein D6719_00355, partial [Candidatus Dadabacteria bacterium]
LMAEYIQKKVSRNFRAHLAGHPLQKQIVETTLANYLANSLGPLFFHEVQSDLPGISFREVVKSAAAAELLLNVRGLRKRIDSYEDKLKDDPQDLGPGALTADQKYLLLHDRLTTAHRTLTLWLANMYGIEHGTSDGRVKPPRPLQSILGLYGHHLRDFIDQADSLYSSSKDHVYKERKTYYQSLGLDDSTARVMAVGDYIAPTFEHILIARKAKCTFEEAISVRSKLLKATGIESIEEEILALEPQDRYDQAMLVGHMAKIRASLKSMATTLIKRGITDPDAIRASITTSSRYQVLAESIRQFGHNERQPTIPQLGAIAQALDEYPLSLPETKK